MPTVWIAQPDNVMLLPGQIFFLPFYQLLPASLVGLLFLAFISMFFLVIVFSVIY